MRPWLARIIAVLTGLLILATACIFALLQNR